MSVNDVGFSGKNPEVSVIAGSKSDPSAVQTIANPKTASTAASATATTPVLSDSAEIVKQAIEQSLSLLPRGREVPVAPTLAKVAGVLNENILSGEIDGIEWFLSAATPATINDLAAGIARTQQSLVREAQLVTEVQSLTEEGSSAGSPAIATLRETLSKLTVEIDQALTDNSKIAQNFFDSVSAVIDHAVHNSVPLATEVRDQLAALSTNVSAVAKEQNPAALQELKESIESVLKQLSNSSNTQVQNDLRQVLTQSTGGTFAGESLSQVSRQVRNFLSELQSSDSITLARDRAAGLIEQLKVYNDDSNGIGLQKTLQRVLMELEHITGNSARASSGRALSSLAIELGSATVQRPAVHDRSLQVSLKELHAHLQNVVLEHSAVSKVESSVGELLKAVDAPSVRQSLEALKETITNVLAGVPSFVGADLAGRSESVRQLIDSHLSRATDGVNALNQRMEEIINADSIEQVLNTLIALRDAALQSASVSQQLVFSFSEKAIENLESADIVKNGTLTLSMYVTLSEVKQDLLGVVQKLMPEGDSQNLLDVLNQRQRTLLRSLEGLLDVAIQEVSSGLEQGAVPSLAQLVDALKALEGGFREGSSTNAIQLADSLNEMTRALVSQSSMQGSGEAILETLMAIRTQIKDVAGVAQKITLSEQLATLQKQVDAVLDRTYQPQAANTAATDVPLSLREVMQTIRSELNSRSEVANPVISELLSKIDTMASEGSSRLPANMSIEQFLMPLTELADSNEALSRAISTLTGILAGSSTQDADGVATNTADMAGALQALENLLRTAMPASTTEQHAAEFQALLDIVTRVQTRGAAADSPFEQSLSVVVQTISGALEQALNGTVEQQQEVLLQFSDLVRKEALKMLGDGPDAKKRAETLKTLKDLETLVRGQEALLSIAPLIEAAGDPVFLLFPMLLDGFLSKIEMTYYGEGEAVKEDAREEKGRKGFKSSALTLELPGLGAVAVSFSHNGSEVLCTLQFEHEQIADFVEVRVGKLESAFSRAGFDELRCSVTTGPVGSVAPEWSQKVSRGGIVA